MGMVVEEVIEGVGFLPNGAVVPARPRPRTQGGYQTFEQMAEQAERMGCGPVYYSPQAGGFVRVAWRNTGETRVVDGAEEAAGYPYERHVALSAGGATAIGGDYLHPTAGWLRGGLKREREHPENVGDTSLIPVQWVPVRNASPSPQAAEGAVMGPQKRPRRVARDQAAAEVAAQVAAIETRMEKDDDDGV